MKKFAVIVFPGSNCDHDAYHAVKHVLGADAEFVWHKENELSNVDAVILPGGFSYGDYLRCGAIARFSPVMREVVRFAGKGGPVIGICNGFQVLTEAGLLPGALIRNKSLRFACHDVHLSCCNNTTRFTSCIPGKKVLRMPIAHGEGNYIADSETIDKLEGDGRVVFRYCTSDGVVDMESNPNGSINNIAGIINAGGNVLGMMPHPERACENLLGSDDGAMIFKSMLS
jgi:phosphoribosylformylglycinamidine synthase